MPSIKSLKSTYEAFTSCPTWGIDGCHCDPVLSCQQRDKWDEREDMQRQVGAWLDRTRKPKTKGMDEDDPYYNPLMMDIECEHGLLMDEHCEACNPPEVPEVNFKTKSREIVKMGHEYFGVVDWYLPVFDDKKSEEGGRGAIILSVPEEAPGVGGSRYLSFTLFENEILSAKDKKDHHAVFEAGDVVVFKPAKTSRELFAKGVRFYGTRWEDSVCKKLEEQLWFLKFSPVGIERIDDRVEGPPKKFVYKLKSRPKDSKDE